MGDYKYKVTGPRGGKYLTTTRKEAEKLTRHGGSFRALGQRKASKVKNPTQTKSEILAGLDSFTEAFADAAIWTGSDESDESGGRPLDENYGLDDFTKDSLKRIIEMCDDFQGKNATLLAAAYEATGNGEGKAGHDFWLTKEGHGAGFWDGDWGDYGDALTEASEGYGSDGIYLYGGKLHLS